MQGQAVVKFKREIDPWSARQSRIQRAKIDEPRGGGAAHDFSAIPLVSQQATPAVEARRTDGFALAEGCDAQLAAAKFRQP